MEGIESFAGSWSRWTTLIIKSEEWESLAHTLWNHGRHAVRVPFEGGVLLIGTDGALGNRRPRTNHRDLNSFLNAVHQAVHEHFASGERHNITITGRRHWLYADANHQPCKRCQAMYVSSDDGQTWRELPKPHMRVIGRFRPDYKRYLRDMQAADQRVLINLRERPEGEATRVFGLKLPPEWSEAQCHYVIFGLKDVSVFKHVGRTHLCLNSETGPSVERDLSEWDDNFCPQPAPWQRQ